MPTYLIIILALLLAIGIGLFLSLRSHHKVAPTPAPPVPAPAKRTSDFSDEFSSDFGTAKKTASGAIYVSRHLESNVAGVPFPYHPDFKLVLVALGNTLLLPYHPKTRPKVPPKTPQTESWFWMPQFFRRLPSGRYEIYTFDELPDYVKAEFPNGKNPLEFSSDFSSKDFK